MTDVALVTGGTGGIGRAICARLAGAGYAVLAGDLGVADPARHDRRGSAGRRARLPDGRPLGRERGSRRSGSLGMGRLTGIVNCAGVLREARADSMPQEEADAMWAVNVMGAGRVTRTGVAAPRSRSRRREHLEHRRVDRPLRRNRHVLGEQGRARGHDPGARLRAGTHARSGSTRSPPATSACPMAPSWASMSGGEDVLIGQVPLGRLGEVERDRRRRRVPPLRPVLVRHRVGRPGGRRASPHGERAARRRRTERRQPRRLRTDVPGRAGPRRHAARRRRGARHDADMILTSGRAWPGTTTAAGQRNAIIYGALYEGLASGVEDADASSPPARSVSRRCQDHGCVGSVAGIYTASMPVFVVENRAFGNLRFCNFYEGESRTAAQLRRLRRRRRDQLHFLARRARADAPRGRHAAPAASPSSRSWAAPCTWATSCTAATPPPRRCSSASSTRISLAVAEAGRRPASNDARLPRRPATTCSCACRWRPARRRPTRPTASRRPAS